jgi:phage terminase Nu1 subunit (DNA packaging protein)
VPEWEGDPSVTSLERDLADAGLPPISNVQQLADVLGVTLKAVYAMNENGLPRTRVGVSLRYSRREVAAYLETLRRGTQPAGVAASRE